MHTIEVVLAMLVAVVASGYLVRILPFSLPLPLVQIALGALISGTVLTETVFSFSGVGRFVANAILVRDYPTIQGFVIVIGLLYVCVNLLVDLAYGLVDPRVRVH